jgi:hypothetical protein
MRVLLNKKIKSLLVDLRKTTRGLRNSIGDMRSVIDKRHLADENAFPCSFDYTITKLDVHFPFEQNIHPVGLVTFAVKEFSGRELDGIGLLIKKLRRIHKSFGSEITLQSEHCILQVTIA